jgi:hypothetical protein
MTRLAAAILLAVLAAFPLTVLSSPPVTWVVVAALISGGAGVAVLSVPLVTLGGSLVLVAHTLALAIIRPPADPVLAIALGATLVLLLALVHLAGHLGRAAIGPSVIAAQVRQWVVVVGAGAAVAAVLAVPATALAALLQGAVLPVVLGVAALGAVLTVVGVFALLKAPAEPSGPLP